MTDLNQELTAAAQVLVRRVTVEDAEAVAALSVQLGYEASGVELRERIERLASCQESQAVFVACMEARLVGWIEVAITYHLQSAPFVLIGGLVVQEGLRGAGIGRRLCEEAEAWTRARGIKVLRVTSRSTRFDTHRFYLRDGFTEVKTSKVFEKLLD
ncbi:GNAT family N-acetyltransferase [Granulicella sp. dw_53]|uniref:GNAT family N-acetyltransferase n=1 Tax=Granulicella sp. dw_53 TaxID=2719792 RepID=UPI001BD5F2AB|nr:GNAT family N-acetyltransferase [Granulicella sp. dw_53]